MVDLQLPASKDDRSSNFSLEGGLDGPHSESFPFSYFPLKGNLVDPRLRASNEHILIVRVPRAGGRPAPSRENNKQAWKEHHGARSRAV